MQSKIRILTVVGARPQFIKAATISRFLKKRKNKIIETIIHTGQHYDKEMSLNFFKELDIPRPHVNLNVGSGTHAYQTGEIIKRLEKHIKKLKPDLVLVYGDTNTTLAASIASSKFSCKLAHIEAGIRSFDNSMPEEINRIATDRLSDFLFCPTRSAVHNLRLEGRSKNVVFVGDVMRDSYLYNVNKIKDKNFYSKKFNNNYILSTIHREANTNNIKNLKNIFSVLKKISKKIQVIIPLHPRTRKIIKKAKFKLGNIKILKPVPYLEMLNILKNASVLITDSGGLQKEAYFSKVPCITVRENTEWIETLSRGWNTVSPPNFPIRFYKNILHAIKFNKKNKHENFFGDGKSAEKIIDFLIKNL
tara:strand:- start:617 stop:1702 length:1086 start_codon:yes stop_codon:yes gene_type:complete